MKRKNKPPKTPRPHCPTCGSRETPSNPVSRDGTCPWCRGEGDYHD